MTLKKPPELKIMVYCRDKTHPTKLCIVTNYRRVVNGDGFTGWDDSTWGERPGTSRRKKREGPARQVPTGSDTSVLFLPPEPDKPSAHQYLDASGRESRRGVPEPRGRERERLECELCEDTVPFRAEKLFPVLDDLSSRGRTKVSLSELRRLVGHSS